ILKKSGFQWNNGLVVDKYLKTNFPDIFGAGDIINFPDPIFKVRRRVEHWGHAKYSGELAAENMLGANKPYDLLTYVWSDFFNLHLEFAGFEKSYDEIKIKGNPQKCRFTALYLKKNKLCAYLQINGSQNERDELEKKIKS
ncbi:NAD(P)/FAD-dependent oxidoreductase, partial [Candidatus Berkelbacteria bacterium]|nr:NAD(P)/FAD-dependent oxidoreductase [Candidatus Berkelbacteria bacterium]